MTANWRTALSIGLLLAVGSASPSIAMPAESPKPAERPAKAFLAGAFVDEHGAPVVGAEIEIAPSRPMQRAAASETRKVQSGPGGAFRIDGLEPGTLYRMVTWKPGFVPREDDNLELSAGLSSMGGTRRLVLRSGRTATGRLVDAAGRPVAEAILDLTQTSTINWIDPGLSALELRLRRAYTGADGAFTLPDLAPGGYELLIHRRGLAQKLFVLEVPAGRGPWNLGRIVITGAVLTGRVTDPSGRALAGASVWLHRETDQIDGWWGRMPNTRTGDDGRFEISGLSPYGEVGLDVCAAGFLPEEVSLRTMPTEEVAIVLQPGGRITGRVVASDGAPVAGARIYTLRDGQSMGGCTFNDRPCDWDEDVTISDAEGRYVLEPLLATTYLLRVHGPDVLPGDVEDVRIGPGETIEDLQITLERGELLSGTVTGPGGKPVAGAAVSVADWWSEGVTGADGRYRLTAIPQGDWKIEIAAEGFEPVAVEMEILPGENRLDWRLELVVN